MRIPNKPTWFLLAALILSMASCSNPNDILANCDSRETVMTMVKEAEEGIPVQDLTVLCSIQVYKPDADLRNERMFKTKPPTEQDWKALDAFVRANQDIGSYHILTAIRRKKPEMYANLSPKTRCRVLVRALEFHLSRGLHNFPWMTSMGLWGPEGEKSPQKDFSKAHMPEHTRALLREGHVAIRYLAPLLKNKSRVRRSWRMWGWRRRKDWRLRVCDYAYHFITSIIDGVRELEPKQEDRDRGIAKLISRIESDR